MKKGATQDELLAEMQAIVRMAAEPRQPVDGIKAALRRASAALGISYRRAMSFWYGDTRAHVTDEEAARLRAERTRLLRLREERLGLEIELTRRLIEEALRHEEAQAADRSVAQPMVCLVVPVGRRQA